MPTGIEYTLTELAALAGVTARTVRYYVSVGLLAAPSQAGPATRYTEDHLQRIRLIRKLQDEHLPLAEIRERITDLDDADVTAALAAGSRGPTDSALDYVRAIQAHASEPPLMLAERSLLAYAVGAPDSAPLPGPVPPPPARPRPVSTRSQWERIPVTPDVEIHVRRPLGRAEQKRVDRLITVAREILEDPS